MGIVAGITLFLSHLTFKFLSVICPIFISILILFCSLLGLLEFHAILNSTEIYVPNYTSYVKGLDMAVLGRCHTTIRLINLIKLQLAGKDYLLLLSLPVITKN